MHIQFLCPSSWHLWSYTSPAILQTVHTLVAVKWQNLSYNIYLVLSQCILMIWQRSQNHQNVQNREQWAIQNVWMKKGQNFWVTHIFQWRAWYWLVVVLWRTCSCIHQCWCHLQWNQVSMLAFISYVYLNSVYILYLQ